MLTLFVLIDPYNEIFRPILTIVGIGAVAIVMLLFAVRIMEKTLPFSVRHEIEEDHNVAAAILMASIILGIAIVIAAVAQG
ncbi:MAG: uncharacterized membrane protein YjfL (UPF0719 family) [Planctomycetota bacterium]|jgi:uncharacterized membrane protein YjfL (UPF0719 family)